MIITEKGAQYLNRFTIFKVVETAAKDFSITTDKAIFQYTYTATQTGPGNYPPTGKAVKVYGVGIIKVIDSKIAESWLYWNNQDWIKQLGYTITPPSTTNEG